MVQASPTKWVFLEPICISVPAGIVVRSCIRLWSVFLEDSFSVFACFLLVIYKHTCPHCAECSAVLTKPHALPSLFTQYHPKPFFLISPDEKSSQSETFYWCGRGKTKMAEALKGIKINKFQNWFEQRKKHLDRCIASNGEHFESNWNLNIKNKHTIFINKFHFGGCPMYIHTYNFGVHFLKINCVVLFLFYWHSILFYFQVQSIAVRQSYTLESGPPGISSPPSTIHCYYNIIDCIPVLYFTSPCLFWNCQFVLLSPFTFLTQLPKLPPLWRPSVCSLCLWPTGYLEVHDLCPVIR